MATVDTGAAVTAGAEVGVMAAEATTDTRATPEAVMPTAALTEAAIPTASPDAPAPAASMAAEVVSTELAADPAVVVDPTAAGNHSGN